MDVLTVLLVPVVLFMLVVAPVWLVLHYRSKRQTGGVLNTQERQELEQLAEQAERMLDRIETLESILDVESPGWRERARQL